MTLCKKQFNNELFLIKVHQRGTFRIEKFSTINFYYRKVIDNLSLKASNLCFFAIEKKSKINSSI